MSEAIRALSTGAVPPEPVAPRAASKKEAEAAAEAFEAFLVGFLSQQMRSTVHDGPMCTGPVALFADLFDQEIGRRVAEGPGMGLKAELAAALGDFSTEELSRFSAGSLRRGALPPAAIDRVTSGFGARIDPFDGDLRMHQGIDIGAPAGSRVEAARDGVVRFAGTRGGYGNVVIVDHGDGTETRYAHCAQLFVEAGARVLAGQQVGTVGSTGRSTGPHLHFEVRVAGVPVDPAQWLDVHELVSPVDTSSRRR
jgi:murein DD-endopeptidase MepM/ murein hydrolase activator NlpD